MLTVSFEKKYFKSNSFTRCWCRQHNELPETRCLPSQTSTAPGVRGRPRRTSATDCSLRYRLTDVGSTGASETKKQILLPGHQTVEQSPLTVYQLMHTHSHKHTQAITNTSYSQTHARTHPTLLYARDIELPVSHCEFNYYNPNVAHHNMYITVHCILVTLFIHTAYVFIHWIHA
jgi:hypothetical protein